MRLFLSFSLLLISNYYYCWSFIVPALSSTWHQYRQDDESRAPVRTVHFYANSGEPHEQQERERNHKSDLYSLSVTELKRLLQERGLDFRDCLEKRDLVERLLSAPTTISARNTGRTPTTNLQQLRPEEQSTIDTFKRVSPTVAYITSPQTPTTSQNFALNMNGGGRNSGGGGSGFLWDTRGHVVTNYHVVAAVSRNNQVKVKLAKLPEARIADIVGLEPEKDLAVLRLRDTTNLPIPIQVGTSNDLQVGQSVLAIGNPFGLDDTLTTGIVSALGRDVQGVGGRPIRNCIQTDAAINPGNSGGPLLDSSGRLIGVNTAIISPNGGSAGIGFAIPVDTVRRVVNQIIRYGKVVRPSLGITIINDRVARSIEQQIGRTLGGVLVADVLPNSPAAAVGLVPTQMRSDGTIILGDVITAVDDERVLQTEDLLTAIEERKEGDVVRLTVLRRGGGKVDTIRVRLSTRQDATTIPGGRGGAGQKVSMFGRPWQ